MIIQTALDYKKNLCFFIPLYNEIKYIQVITSVRLREGIV